MVQHKHTSVSPTVLRRTCSAHPPVSQPFSARTCRRGNCWGTPPELLCFLCSLTFLFFVVLPFLLIFASFLPYCLPERAFSISFRAVFRCGRRVFSRLFVVRGTYFCTYDVLLILNSVYDIRACCRRASSGIYFHHRPSSTASTAQRSQPAQQAAKQLRAVCLPALSCSDRRVITLLLVARVSWLALACRRA